MFSPYNTYGWLAQSVEQQAVNLRVGGSSPSPLANQLDFCDLRSEPKKNENHTRFQHTVSRKYKRVQHGELAELVDALDLGSSAARRKGSSPLFPTNRARGPGLTNTSIFSVSYETLGGWQLHQNINKLRYMGP